MRYWLRKSQYIFKSVDKGILYKKRGIGMFVQQGAKEKIKNQRKSEFYENYIQKLIVEANNLGISKKELVNMITESSDGK